MRTFRGRDRRRSPSSVRRAAGTTLFLPLLMAGGTHPSFAQAAAPAAPQTPAPSSSTAPQTLAPNAPANPTAAPGTPATVPGAPMATGPAASTLPAIPVPKLATPGSTVANPNATGAGPTITLDQLVAQAVAYNTQVQIARQRLQKAQENITQVDAFGRPQVSATVADTYSSQPGFAAQGASVLSPQLPGGGAIPVITDQGGGNTGAFVGGGGGGTSGTATGNTGTGTATGIGTTAPGTLSPTGTTGTGTGGASTGTGTGTTGTGTFGTGTGTGTGTFGTGTGTGTTGGTSSGMSRPGVAQVADLPPVVAAFAAAAGAPAADSGRTAKAEPRQTGTGGGTTNQPPGTTGSTFNAVSGNRNNYSARATVTQYIDIFGILPAARSVETITRDFYALDLERVQNETALSARDQFFTVLQDQALVGVDQEQVAYATQNLTIARARFAAGAAAQYDVLTAQATLSNDQQALSTAQNQLRLAFANLNNLLGLNASAPVTLLVPPLPALGQQFDLNANTQTALQRRPELRQADNNLTIAQRLIKLAGAGLLPTLGVAGTAGYTGPSGTSVGGLGSHDSYSITAQVSLPLYDGGTTRSRVRQAQVDLQTQQVTRAQLQENVRLEVLQALSNISDAQTRAASAGVGVTAAEEALRIAQLRYENGLGTFLDITNAAANLATARNNLATAQFNYQTALAQLLRAEGGR